MKIATCISVVPSILSPTGAEISIGETVEYVKVIFVNGEHHLVLSNAKKVPAVFFDF